MDGCYVVASCREQFYLLLPLFVRHLSYRGIIILAVASILSAPVVRFIIWLSGNVYMGPFTLLPCRSDALGMGVLVALACRDKEMWEWLASRRRQLYLAFLLLGCGVVFLLKYQRHLYTIGLTWIAAFYALLLLLTVVNPGRLETSCFRSQGLVKLGAVAYAVYVFHQGINFLFHFIIFGRTPSISNWSSLTATLLSFATVILLSAVSWRLVEKPLIRYAHTIYRYWPAALPAQQ
jgi:peptidoglycan/LPS O-acetylase OafA/YrhL